MSYTETQIVDSILKSRRAMLAMGGATLASLAFAPKAKAQSAAIDDNDILNFALNLEYMEAQFYNLAAYGVTLDHLATPVPVSVNGGTAGGVTLKPNFAAVPFATPAISNAAQEIANKEAAHVLFLQNVLGMNAVSMPAIDLYNSFNALAMLAGIGATFDPFANESNYLIGAFLFEDVGVTAYTGAAALITDKVNVLPGAAGLSGAEAYFAGVFRTLIASVDDQNGTLATLTQKVAAARSTLANPTADDPATADDVGIMMTTVALNTAAAASTTSSVQKAKAATKQTISARPKDSTGTFPATTIVDADPDTSRVYTRTTDQILAIVTGGGVLNGQPANKGGFFPNGLNGTIV